MHEALLNSNEIFFFSSRSVIDTKISEESPTRVFNGQISFGVEQVLER